MANIFLMENEPNISSILENVLTDEGHCVTTAGNGAAGLEKLFESPKPDMVLLDLNTTGSNGQEVTQRMKASTDFNDIPVVIMSGRRTYSDDFSLKDNYEAILYKPFDLSDLISVVNRLTSLKKLKKAGPAPQF